MQAAVVALTGRVATLTRPNLLDASHVLLGGISQFRAELEKLWWSCQPGVEMLRTLTSSNARAYLFLGGDQRANLLPQQLELLLATENLTGSLVDVRFGTQRATKNKGMQRIPTPCGSSSRCRAT